MKKIIFGFATAFALFFFSVQLQAQENIGSTGVELAVPMGDFGDVANFGYGVSGQFELGLTDRLGINLNAGFLMYAMEGEGFKFTHVPIQVGGRFYFSEAREGVFVGVRAGIHLGISEIDDIEVGGIKIEGSSDSKANFSFAPEIGYFLTDNISLALRYQIITAGKEEVSDENPITGEVITQEVDGNSSSYLGLRIAFNF